MSFYKIAAAEDQLFFVATSTVGIVFSFLLLAFAWLRLNDWYSYMGFLFDKGGERAGKRATRYIQRTGSDLWVFILGAGFAVFCASGLFLEVIERMFTGAVSPFN